MEISVDLLTGEQLTKAIQTLSGKTVLSNNDKISLRRLTSELRRRQLLQAELKKETSEVPKDHPEREALLREMLLRFRCNFLNKETSMYGSNYHEWFKIREIGLDRKLYKCFIPTKDEPWRTP